MPNNIAKNLTQEYWDKLLSENTDLKGVGWPNWPESYNLILYKKYLKGFNDVIQSLFSNHSFSLNSEIRVFEAGPGTGFYTNYFWLAGVKNYTGADISQASVDKLKSKYQGYNFLRKDISLDDEYLELNKGSFDLVCIVDVLLHITDDAKFRNAVKNLCLLLKPGGYLIIGDAISIYRKKSHSEGTKYTHDVSRHIDYLNERLKEFGVSYIDVFHRKNFYLNKNFDFKYSIFEWHSKFFFFFLNGGLSVFRNSNFIGKVAGYPLSLLDSIVTAFQKYSKNSKFILYKKSS